MQSSVAAAGSHAGIDGRLSSPPLGGAVGSVSCTLDTLCIDRFSGQSWHILDFPLGEFFGGLVQVFSCLALSLPIGVRSGFASADFSSLWSCLVVRI